MLAQQSLVCLLVLFIFCGSSLAQSTEKWNLVSTLPIPLSDQTADTVGSLVFLTGGCSGNQVCDFTAGFCSCTNITDKAFVFNPVTYEFSPLPDMPRKRYRHISCVWRELIIIMGGRDLEDNIIRQVDVLNTTSRSWSTRKSLVPEQIGSDNGCFTLQDIVYVMGGYNADYSVSTNATFKYFPDSDTWNVSSSHMIRGRGDFASVELNGKGYVYGGYEVGDFCTAISFAEKYDPNLDAWVPVQSLSGTTADNSDGVVLGGRILSLGGEKKKTAKDCTDWDITPTREVYGFNVTYNSWASETLLPDARFRFSATVVNEKLYIFGGQGSVVNKTGLVYFPLLLSVYEYNINAPAPPTTLPNYWSRLPSLPFSRSDFTADTVNGLVYLTGGCYAIQRCHIDEGFCGCLLITDDVQVFDPKALTFSTLPTMPSPRYRHISCVWQDSIYVFGGRTMEDNTITAVDVYNTTSRTWKASVISAPNDIGTDNGCFTIGDSIYIMGGYNSDYSVAFNTTYIYSPTANRFTRTSQMAYGRGDFASAVLNGVGYIYGGYAANDFCKPLPIGEKIDTTGTWSAVAALTGTTADQRASATNDGRIISIGGERKLRTVDCHDWEIIPSSDVVSFLPSSNQWRNETSMPDARFRFGAAVVDDKIYVFGGQGPLVNNSIISFYPVLSSVYRFDYAQKQVDDSGLSKGQIAGIVIGVIAFVIIVIVVIVFVVKSRSGGFESAGQASSTLST